MVAAEVSATWQVRADQSATGGGFKRIRSLDDLQRHGPWRTSLRMVYPVPRRAGHMRLSANTFAYVVVAVVPVVAGAS
jgi:hypothetical protein